ncbi:MAG: type ISP restriction/modification enzyme, partial [Candidatus Binatia bacterium]
ADPHKKTADDFAAHMRTNPFLRELMETFLKIGGRRGKAGGPGIDFDELGVSEVMDLLDDANMEAVVRDFGDRNPQEDPVIHFYEGFAKEYDPIDKVKRGEFYTPRPVVSYIVRSVDELLRTEFGLEDGLADTASWREMARRHKDLKIPKGVPASQDFVQILDAATGTGTFLVEVINLIHKTLTARWKAEGHGDKKIEALWNEYVPKHLLPRLHAYELKMAPYAIAHLKIGLKLYETDYHFSSDVRARIYLTNALHPPSDKQLSLEFLPALAHEAQAVNEIKRTQRFTVVIGNPPYSKHSVNRGAWIDQLLGSYKEDVRSEQNIQPLSDDYIKFVRFAHDQIERTGYGVVGFVTNHSYLSGVIHRGMRRQLMISFPDIRVVELHGDSNRGEVCPDGSKDENVFDIQQGVAITLATTSVSKGISVVRHHDLWGLRATKYEWLASHDALNTPWRHFSPVPTQYSFQATTGESGVEYQYFRSVTEIFQLHAAGFVTSLDEIAIKLSAADMMRALREFESCKPRGLRERAAHEDLVASGVHSSRVIKVLYRPFDYRYTYYTGNTGGFHDRPRHELMQHVLRPNLALVTTRLIARSGSFEAVLSSRFPVEKKAAESSRSCYLLPLYVYPARDESGLFDKNLRENASRARRPNLSRESIATLKSELDLTFVSEQPGLPSQMAGVFGPEDVFGYIYSVLHSRTYRERYGEFLRIDFPRVPLTPDRHMFWNLVALGRELVLVQLMESPELDTPISTYIGPGRPEVKRVGWSDDTVWLDAAATKKGQPATPGTIGFRGVPEKVWNFHIGGYQVCEKWLKDRKGRKLSNDDIAHYQKIVVALNETIRLMKEIDEVIEKHGGWPGAFQPGETKDVASKVIPFRPRIVEPKPEDRYKNCVPLVPLKAAAGAFSDPQPVEDDGFEWVAVESRHRLRKGMFVAQVVGKSMEPAIPDGAYCLFRAPVEGTRQGKTVLVQLRDTTDPETGQRYTVKRYESEKSAKDDSWRHERIILKPVNPDFAPIVLTGAEEGELQVIAELVEVLASNT